MKSEVLKLLSNEISSKWRDFGDRLEISGDVLDGIEQNQTGSSAMFGCVVQYWLDKSDESDCTWETIITILKDMSHKKAASKVTNFLGQKLATEGRKIL